MTKRVYLFGIGSPAWKKAQNVTISPLGVPISLARSTRRLVVKPVATFGFSSSSGTRRRRKGGKR